MPVSSEKTAEITLSSLLGAHAPPSVTVITSPDTLRRSQAVRQSEERFSSRDARCVIRARETSLEAIKTELFSSSLFGANNSLIIVKSAHELPTAIAKGLRQILAKKNVQLTPILFEGEPLAASHPLTAIAKDVGVVVAFEELKDAALYRWIRLECKARDIAKIEDEAVAMLAQGGEGSLDRTSQLIEICSLTLDPSQPLTASICGSIIQVPSTSKEFALIDALTSRNRAAAEALLVTLLISGVSPFPLLSLINKTFSNFLAIHSLTSRRVDEGAIQKLLGMQPWLFRKQRDIAIRLNPSFLRAAYRAIIAADSKMKNRSLGPDIVLSELVAKLTS
jgi:DNA polymerase III delta subunit